MKPVKIMQNAPKEASIMSISSPNPILLDHLLESSHRDNSNKWSNIGFIEEITQVESIKVNFTGLF